MTFSPWMIGMARMVVAGIISLTIPLTAPPKIMPSVAAMANSSMIIMMDEFAYIQNDAPLYAAASPDALSDSFLPSPAIIRLDGYDNGYVRIQGCEWFVPYNAANNINIMRIDSPLRALPIHQAVLRSGVGERSPVIGIVLPGQHRMDIYGSSGRNWLVMVDGVYGFIDMDRVIVLPSSLLW